MMDLIWVQTVSDSDGIPDFVSEKNNFEKESAENKQACKNYTVCNELNSCSDL